MVRKQVGQTVLVVTVGVAMTFVVAWLLAINTITAGSLITTTTTSADPPVWVVDHYHRLGTTITVGMPFATNHPALFAMRMSGHHTIESAIEAFGTDIGDPTNYPITYRRLHGEVGWPFRALAFDVCGEVQLPPRSFVNPTITNGIALGQSGLEYPFSETILPLRPIWAGFLLDSASFAMLICLANVSRRHLVRTLRTRSGRCANCGYLLQRGQYRCPECGMLEGKSTESPVP